jgi:PAS domain S-box-containing protein
MNTKMLLKILFVEDVPSDAELAVHELRKEKLQFEYTRVDTRDEFIKTLNDFRPDIVISDYNMPSYNGMQALKDARELDPLIPFILFTGSQNEETAVKCLKAGADDYILKDNLSRMGPAVVNSLNKAELLKQKENADDALMRSEERYRLLVEKSPDAIAVHHDGKFIYVNPAGAKLIGAKNPHDLIGISILDIIHPDSRKKVIDRLRQENEGKEVPLMEEKFVKLDGSVIDVEVIGIPVTYQGLPAGQVIVRDISERKIAEKALRESEKKYRHIFENVLDVYYETSIEGTILNLSPSISIMSKGQYDQADLVGKSMYDFYTDPEKRKLIVAALKEKGNVPDFEIRLKNRDGSSVPCSISAKIIFSADGHPEKIIGSMRDISKRKRAEEALQHNLAFSESLLKTIPFGMDIVDETGTLLFQSESFKILFGKEAVGKKCWNIYRDDKKQCGDCPLRKGITVGETEVYESHGVLGNRIFEINHSGMMYKGKKAMLEIFQDITERKENEKELIKSKEKAEESDRLKTAFLHNISHEIRTPMNAIVGFSALLGELDLDAQSQQSYIETIMQSSNHLLSIITDIIDISNIEANIVKIARNEINVNFTLNSICNQFLPKTIEKKIKLVCESGLSDSEALIISDNTKLTQILTNLISNAIKFTDEGIVKLSYRNVANFLEFSVSDTGIGIPYEYYEKIFDRFYQVQNAVSRLYEGTGLGLAISKAYVELMGGKIWLSSKPGKGTTFYFTIPYESHPDAPEPVLERRAYEGFVFAEKKTILVAEDVDSNFKLITYFLSDANTKLLRAVNGKEAVNIALTEKGINLILMDIKMPEMDGYTAAKLLREANIKIPIIAQTAYADDKETALENGCNGFISKPFDKKHLIKVLCEFI